MQVQSFQSQHQHNHNQPFHRGPVAAVQQYRGYGSASISISEAVLAELGDKAAFWVVVSSYHEDQVITEE